MTMLRFLYTYWRGEVKEMQVKVAKANGRTKEEEEA